MAEGKMKEVNAFRVVPEAGKAYFLDFLHYSPKDQRAEVVSRLRLHEAELKSFRDRLARDLQEAEMSFELKISVGDIAVLYPLSQAVN